MTGTEEIGCCGAYCKTCREFQKTCKSCKSCKLGYWDGARDVSRAKCKIKKCYLTKEYCACAECPLHRHTRRAISEVACAPSNSAHSSWCRKSGYRIICSRVIAQNLAAM